MAPSSPVGPICLVDSHLEPAFRELGVEVVHLCPSRTVVDIGSELANRNVDPARVRLLLQEERLTARVFLTGLEELRCPKLFRAIDPHLNLFWQVHYGRLFDLVLSTQKRYQSSFQQAGIKAAWLPWHGSLRPFIPHDKRPHSASFVGRLTPERPLRQAFADFLAARHNATLAQDLSQPAMLDLYAGTRLAPNESILGEINFRLFEAASTGCAVLTQSSDELPELFEPGREVETYAHVLELDDKLRLLSRDPRRAETLGRAAWARIRLSHLPSHRAKRVLDLAEDLPGQAATGPGRAKSLLLAALALQEADRPVMPLVAVLEGLKALPGDPEVAAGLLRLLKLANEPHTARELAVKTLAKNEHPGSLALNLAGSMTGLWLGLFDVAKQFWYRQARAMGMEPRKPEDQAGLLKLWAGPLASLGRHFQIGLKFDPARHLPQTAAECLLGTLALNHDDLEATRLLEELVTPVRGLEMVSLGLLSRLSLAQPDDWRVSARLGLVNLRAFRLQEGQADLAQAAHLAGLAGQARHLGRLVRALDPSGLVHERLTGPAPGQPEDPTVKAMSG